MTQREFYKGVIASAVTGQVKAFAESELAKMDARNEKRRNTQTKEQVANEGLKADILDTIGDERKVASEIASALGISTQKVSALCKQMVDSGILVKEEVAIKGKGKVLGYKKMVG